MNATIEKPKRSILAEQPASDRIVVGGDSGLAFADRRARPGRAMVAAVSVTVVLAATFAWASLGDSDAQLVETETATPATTGPPAESDNAPARSRLDRSRLDRTALVVDVDRPDPDSASRSTAITAPTTTTGESADRPSGADPGPAISASTVVRTSASAALRVAEASSSTTGSISPPSTVPTSTPTNALVDSRPTSSSATTSTSPPSSSSVAPPSGVAWEEHFNSLDTGRWKIEHSTYGDGNGERQCYQPDNVRVASGRLVLTARAETATCPNGSERTVTSGMVRSRGLTFSPGQAIEFRVKLTPPDPSNQAGLWPAVWASSWAGSWPRGGELDFLEVMTAEDPRRAVFSMHYADRSGGHELQNKGVPLAGYFSDSWHTIRFDYGRNGNLAWFLDGSKVFSVSAADTAQGYPAPFDETIHEIKLNLAVGGTPGPLASGALGSTGASFEIDYIRVINL